MRPANGEKFLSCISNPLKPVLMNVHNRQDSFVIQIYKYLEDFDGMKKVAERVKQGHRK